LSNIDPAPLLGVFKAITQIIVLDIFILKSGAGLTFCK